MTVNLKVTIICSVIRYCRQRKSSGCKLLLCSRPTVGIKRCFVCPSLCLFVPFSDSSRSLDGDMRASPFQTHSKGGSTVGYARIEMLSVGEHITSLHDTLLYASYK